MIKISNSQACEMMDIIAENSCKVLRTFADEDFFSSYIEKITEVINISTRETFVKVCDVLEIESVEDSDDEYDDDYDETGFDPYEGCYTYDC